VIIALAIPAYQQRVHIGTALALAQDNAYALSQGWRPLLLWTDCNSIEVARNKIVKQAIDAGARLLLMTDSDTFAVDSGLEALWRTMQETGAAVVGAAVPVRNGASMNCEPAKPGEVYEGVVGTGCVLIDLVKLRSLPKPWFRVELSEDGTEKAVGSDVGFCRAVQAHGQRVIVDYRTPMAHASVSIDATRP
jgi:hypothetical protein